MTGIDWTCPDCGDPIPQTGGADDTDAELRLAHWRAEHHRNGPQGNAYVRAIIVLAALVMFVLLIGVLG